MRVFKRYTFNLAPFCLFKENYSELCITRSILSNCDDDWKPKNTDDSIELAQLLSKKIPRPYNFFYVYFALNHINFSNRTTEQACKPDGSRVCDGPLSSNIFFWREATSGTKYNLVRMIIDVTDDEAGTAILDDSQYL